MSGSIGGEDDRPDCGDMAFACGKLESSVRRGKGFLHSCGSLGSPGKEKSRTMENPGRMTGRTVQKNPKSAARQMSPWQTGEQKTGSILADGEQGEEERFDERQAKKVCAGAKEPDPAEHKELEQANPAVRRKQRGGLFRRIWERIRAFFAGLVRKLRQLRAGIKEALKKIKDVRTFLTDERHREALPLILQS